MIVLKSQKFSKEKIKTIVFRIVLILVLLEIGLRISGYGQILYQDSFNIISASKNNTYNILVLGDSLSQSGGSDSWPRQLEGILNNKNSVLKFKVINRAVSGDNTENILSTLDERLASFDPDMVVMMAGTMDVINESFIGKNTSFIGKNTLFFEDFRVYKLSKFLLGYFKNQITDNNIIKNINTPAERHNLSISSNETEELFKKAIEIDTNKTDAYTEVEKIYFYFNDSEKTVRVFTDVGWHYLSNNKSEEAEKWFNAMMRLNPNILADVYIGIRNRYFEEDENATAYVFNDWARNLRDGITYIPSVQDNFRKIYEKVNKKGIRLVAVQYPIVSVEQLKSIFKGDEDIIFVSNEENFKEALKTYDYYELFKDKDRVAFGHANEKGNGLIAENVANAVLKSLNIFPITNLNETVK